MNTTQEMRFIGGVNIFTFFHFAWTGFPSNAKPLGSGQLFTVYLFRCANSAHLTLIVNPVIS